MWYIGENSIVIVSGANDRLTPADVGKAESLISSASVLICQLEVPPETSLSALALAKKHGGQLIFYLFHSLLSCCFKFNQ